MDKLSARLTRIDGHQAIRRPVCERVTRDEQMIRVCHNHLFPQNSNDLYPFNRIHV